MAPVAAVGEKYGNFQNSSKTQMTHTKTETNQRQNRQTRSVFPIKSNICGVMVIVIGNRHEDTSSNPGWDCISHSTNTLGKGMNPIILPPAMGK